MDDFEDKARQALANPQNVGEMDDADAVGTAGSADCGDMLRMWLKFTEKDGNKVIDRASFQSFGCQTAIAVASMATELLKGKSVEEARELSPDELTGELGPLPPNHRRLLQHRRMHACWRFRFQVPAPVPRIHVAIDDPA